MIWAKHIRRTILFIGWILFIQPIDAHNFECGEGTLLFKEDFGGNHVEDAARREEPLPDSINNLNYSSHLWRLGYQAYGLRKEAIIRRKLAGDPPHIYSDWYADFGDHTYESDTTKGYFMQIDLDYFNPVYVHKLNNLSHNTQLYFSVWGHPVNASSDAPITLSIEDSNGYTFKQRDFVIDHENYAWQKFGIFFSVPEDVTSIVCKVYCGASGSGGDLALDDIEIRQCSSTEETIASTQNSNEKKWFFEASLGGIFNSGNINDLGFNTAGEISRNDSLISFLTNYKFIYKKDNETLRNKELKASIKTDILQYNRWSPFVAIEFITNKFKAYDYKISALTGVKLRIYDKPDLCSYSISAAFMFDRVKYTPEKSILSERNYRLSLRPKIRQKIGDVLTINCISFYQPSFENFNDYIFDTSVNFDCKISTHFFICTGFYHEYRSKLPTEDYKRNDFSTEVSLTVKF
ncbi:MAG: DUF481 domain-containing protein [Bacteroidales bacterium]|nr:DUF481 domain-containing protein [Bacteroidales bacterium]